MICVYVYVYIYTQIISPCYNPIPNTKPTLGDGYDLSSESTPHSVINPINHNPPFDSMMLLA